MRLQNKVIVTLGPLIIIPILIVGVVAHVFLYQTAKERTFGAAQTVLYQLSSSLESLINNTAADAKLFSETELVKKYMQIEQEEERYAFFQKPLMRQFVGFQESHPEYAEIRIILPDGFEDTRITSNGIPNKTEEETDSLLYQTLIQLQEKSHFGFYPNPDTGKFVLYASRRIHLRNESLDPIDSKPIFRGWLVVTVSLDAFAKTLQKTTFAEGGSVFSTTLDGEIMHHPDITFQGRFLPALIVKKLNTDEWSGGFPQIIKTDDMNAFIMARNIANKMFLCATIPQSSLTKTSRQMGLIIFFIMLITSIITYYTFFVFLRQTVVSPILRLNKAVREVGRGNIKQDLDLNTKDEVGELAQSFEEMSNNLNQYHEQIQHIAFHDNLTSLPNRRMFEEYLQHSIGRALRYGETLAVLLIDIDNFKRINDTLGHKAGDQLLKLASRSLTSSIRQEDFVARPEADENAPLVSRLGGDEFTLVLPFIKDTMAAASIAKRVVREISKPYDIEGHKIYITVSIGITIFPNDGKDAQTLIKNADIAMYHAKETGRNIYQYYSDSMNALALERLTMESSLRQALVRDEFVLHYQPQVDVKTGRILGVEALVRWQHPELGMVPPGQFIPIAEESGLIVPLGEWVLEAACKQLREWREKGFQDITVSVNLSSLQFQNKKLHKLLADVLRKTALPPHVLDIELTESSIMEAEESAIMILLAIKELGVRISLDDFGTGYSSFSYLRVFPIDTLKIDRSFIKDLNTDKNCRSIATAIIAMAHSLDLNVTAEGVEEESQYDFLQENDCDAIQGFLFSRPLPADEVGKLLEKAVLKPEKNK